MAYVKRTLGLRVALVCAIGTIGILTASDRVCAQEPAPATSSGSAPPPPSWGGAESTAAQPAAVPGETFDSDSTTTTTTTTAPSSGEPDSIKDSSPHLRPQMISVFTGFQFGHFAGFGFPMMLGGRYYIPIVPDGFLPSVNDEFALEFGLDLNFTFLSDIYADSVLFGFGVPAEAVWDFHFSPKFDAYGKVGFVFGSAFNSGYGGFWWDFRTHVGIRLKLNDVMYFRAEVGYPTIMAGLGFAL
jgi:hypothetical protein